MAMTRSEYFYTIAQGPRLKRTWGEILDEIQGPEDRRAEQRKAQNKSASPEALIFYNPERRFRKWRYHERYGRRTKILKSDDGAHVGPWRMTEAEAIQDKWTPGFRLESDWRETPWKDAKTGQVHQWLLFDWLLFELKQADDSRPELGTILLTEYEPRISTRRRSLWNLWVLADEYRRCRYWDQRRRLWVRMIQAWNRAFKNRRVDRDGD